MSTDDAVLQAARTLAQERCISVGATLLELARRGLAQHEPAMLVGLAQHDRSIRGAHHA